MKKLNIEEKAKRYDEAFKEASVAHKDEDRHLKATLERIFPELKEESEDERIRKALIEGFNEYTCYFFNGIEKEKIIDWLEKQKAIDVLDEEEREFADNVDSYQKGYNEGVKATLEKQGEHKPEWTPMDEQITELKHLLDGWSFNAIILESLYDDLKKLKG